MQLCFDPKVLGCGAVVDWRFYTCSTCFFLQLHIPAKSHEWCQKPLCCRASGIHKDYSNLRQQPNKFPQRSKLYFQQTPTTTSPAPHTAPSLQGDPAVKPGCEGVRRLKRSSRQEQSLPVNIYYEQRYGQAKHCHPDLA
ncbi:hypothetical protein SRHO_G00128880 [Serrasalmus rhombeus]